VPSGGLAAWRSLGAERYDPERLRCFCGEAIAYFAFRGERRNGALRSSRHLITTLGELPGATLQERWDAFERQRWPGWVRGAGRPPGTHWPHGARTLQIGRVVRSDLEVPGRNVPYAHLLEWLPADDPFRLELERLGEAIAGVSWVSPGRRQMGHTLGLRLMLIHGYDRIDQITEADLREIPGRRRGADALDGALCRLGIFDRTPRRGTTRMAKATRLTPRQFAEKGDMPNRFRPITGLYLETYAARVGCVYGTLRTKRDALARFWRYIDERHPTVAAASEVRPEHGRPYVAWAIEEAMRVGRAGAGPNEDKTTAYAWLVDVRTFFSDLIDWAAEPGSPFAGQAPPAPPLTRNDLRGVGFEKRRRRRGAKTQATVLDLEREMPKIRAHALRQWQDAADAAEANPGFRTRRREQQAFWDWALVELLVQSGLRVEEACQLTTFDVLKRRLADGQLYYMLHIKPSKFDRARVLPIGDSLGRVIAEMVLHIKRAYGSEQVPPCDAWDEHEKRPLPRAPYLLQASRQPGVIATEHVRYRLARLSQRAGARKADGEPLKLRPHDCRRAFASEHLNNNTPIPVIQALLGHATPDTVMIYAKLYPSRLVEEYRKALRGAYLAFHGQESLRNPTAEEWRAFEHSCSMRDMGTHLCALPTGEHCPKGLGLSRLHPRPTQTQRDPDLPHHAPQPPAGPDPGPQPQRTRRPDRGARARDRPHPRRPPARRGTHRGRRWRDRGVRPSRNIARLTRQHP
jgi:integrase